jgi:hypothetical protein
VRNAERLDFVIVGAAGYMGWNALRKEALPLVLKKLRSEGVDARLHAIADYKFEEYPDIRWKLYNKLLKLYKGTLGVELQAGNNIAFNSAGVNQVISDGIPTIVYHAGHPNYRVDDAYLFLDKENLYLLGEKPFVFYKDDLQGGEDRIDAEALPPQFLFCNFTETENAVFHAARDYLSRNKSSIRQLWFWRAGASGLKHSIAAERPGITGGALLDKAPHDLALTVALLGPEAITDFKITKARMEQVTRSCPLPHKFVAPFLDLENSPHGFIDEETADAVTSFSAKWTVGCDNSTHEVEARYLFSWLSYTGARFGKATATDTERQFIEQLEHLGLTRADWLMQAPYGWGPIRDWGAAPDFMKDDSASHSVCYADQVRIGIIDCTDGERIICNFYRDLNNNRGPYARVIDQEGNLKEDIEIREETRETFGRIKAGDMANVLLRMARHAISEGREPARFLDSKCTLQVHRALFAAREFAMRDAMTQRDAIIEVPANFHWYDRSAPTYLRGIQRIPAMPVLDWTGSFR